MEIELTPRKILVGVLTLAVGLFTAGFGIGYMVFGL